MSRARDGVHRRFRHLSAGHVHRHARADGNGRGRPGEGTGAYHRGRGCRRRRRGPRSSARRGWRSTGRGPRRWTRAGPVSSSTSSSSPSRTCRTRRCGPAISNENFDVLVIPSMSTDAIVDGLKIGTVPPQYAGGITADGVRNIKSFVESGGTLVLLNHAALFAIDRLGVPVTDVLKEFKLPGPARRRRGEGGGVRLPGLGAADGVRPEAPGRLRDAGEGAGDVHPEPGVPVQPVLRREGAGDDREVPR